MLGDLYIKIFKDFKRILKKESKYIVLPICIALVLTFGVAFTTSQYSNKVSGDIADSLLRLHIRANSNKEYDQNLKIKIRDRLLYEFEEELRNANSKTELIEFIETSYDDIIEVCEDVIKQEGYNYDVRAKIDETYIETRKYGNVYLPAGIYDALVIEIGTGEGDNWWCVLFPPLCYLESTTVITNKDKQILESNLTDEEYDIITGGNETDIQFKFKILEFWGKQKNSYISSVDFKSQHYFYIYYLLKN